LAIAFRRPMRAMLISGAKAASDGTPFKVVTGHGAFVAPFIRQASFLTLAMREAEVAEQCVTTQGIALQVKAVIAFKVGNDSESIVNAAQRFLSDQDQMAVLTGRIFAGHLRSIIGSMTVEEIVTERQKLATEVLDGSKAEMARTGLIVDSLQIQSIDHMGMGYVEAMVAPHNAAIQRQANQAAAEAEQASQRQQREEEEVVQLVDANLALHQDPEGAVIEPTSVDRVDPLHSVVRLQLTIVAVAGGCRRLRSRRSTRGSRPACGHRPAARDRADRAAGRSRRSSRVRS